MRGPNDVNDTLAIDKCPLDSFVQAATKIGGKSLVDGITSAGTTIARLIGTAISRLIGTAISG
ncbi:MAG: hypothetical protein PVG89_17680 [Gammaproteobacteria bacterium]